MGGDETKAAKKKAEEKDWKRREDKSRPFSRAVCLDFDFIE